MKKILAIMFSVLLIALTATGCSENTLTAENEELKIVCTVFPQYDYIRNILGSEENVSLLVESGGDLHSYQPTARDILEISQATMFVHIGGSSDNWVDAALKAAQNPDLIKVSLVDMVNLCEVESLEEHKHSHADSHSHNHEHSNGEACEADEHIWLSVKNSIAITKNLCEIICNTDPENAEIYRKNTENYISKLEELDKKFEETIGTAKRKTVVFADRFPFIYLINDYKMEYFAAFSGCSSESEASFETISFLNKKITELSLPAVFITESSDGSIAKTVVYGSQTEIYTLDSMQSVSSKDIENGADYIEIMTKNLEILKEALN